MRIGICTFYLMISDSQSLKDKRQVLKSLKDKMRNKFNISIAEVEAQNHHRQKKIRNKGFKEPRIRGAKGLSEKLENQRCLMKGSESPRQASLESSNPEPRTLYIKKSVHEK